VDGTRPKTLEFQKLGGQLIYDQLMGKLDPEAVKMQFQVS